MIHIHNTLFRPLTLEQARGAFPGPLLIYKVVNGIALVSNEDRPEVAAFIDSRTLFGSLTEQFPIFSRFQRERTWMMRKRLTEKLERALHPERFEEASA